MQAENNQKSGVIGRKHPVLLNGSYSGQMPVTGLSATGLGAAGQVLA